ncbi:hypothetical protein GRO01_10780 [Gluconobacter roseus NBRC 3990]|uniref:Uncharacterized protein n=1 Tax=Gluconobacter roseus NBRC 3990 TaxID=1307950 RepID=A0A4Y3M2I1_9PROT|nr:hypothetical protein AD943_03995 [Gluconobacter roseus]GBR47864.1 hypothetical protein AA3990_1918 [Gluconobacter roseus NBRC 3990]GEB03502.1 hypothetical protein GRO01_10780 [Gluconobacter roseus NBRC 3990]GLP93957.1 hypothetical protein GCM10007871_19350 [Gluconobacter roseus NBRC 3990]
MDQQVLTEAVAVIVPISQHGPGLRSWKCHQGIYGFIVRDLSAGEDKAKRTALIVASGVDFARKADA